MNSKGTWRNMTLIDTHVHIDFYPDPMKVALEYEALKIYAMFVTNLPEIFKKHSSSFKNFKYVRLCIGYHPQVSSEYKLNKDLFSEYVQKTRYVGEVGLDFQESDELNKQEQIQSFKYITSEKFNKGRVYSIHSKGTEDIIINILKKNNVKHAIFHWYSGKLTTLDEIANQGYYFSVNPKMLYSKNGQKILNRIPKHLLLFETDGPFARLNRKVLYPKDLKRIYLEFENLIPDFENIVFKNFRRLLIEKDMF